MTEEVYRFLTAPRETGKAIRAQEARIRGFEAALPPKAIRYDTDKVQVRPGDQISSYAEKLADMRDRLDELQRLRLAQIEAIDRAAAILDPDERTVITLHYICGERYEQIMDEMPCSRATVFRLHRKGTQKIRVPKVDTV